MTKQEDTGEPEACEEDDGGEGNGEDADQEEAALLQAFRHQFEASLRQPGRNLTVKEVACVRSACRVHQGLAGDCSLESRSSLEHACCLRQVMWLRAFFVFLFFLRRAIPRTFGTRAWHGGEG